MVLYYIHAILKVERWRYLSWGISDKAIYQQSIGMAIMMKPRLYEHWKCFDDLRLGMGVA